MLFFYGDFDLGSNNSRRMKTRAKTWDRKLVLLLSILGKIREDQIKELPLKREATDERSSLNLNLPRAN